MQLSLYRAERPEVFEDIIGQKQIVRILKNQLSKGTVSQAYLFTGTHGTGKTTTARILAKAVNCFEADNPSASSVPCGECENCQAIKDGRFVDVVELDAASNNGVDDIRSIIDLVQYPPTIGKYKVVIIDEVHMLSTAAENAFLKTLEEPPSYVIFILATTDPQKVRATIRSRCMELNFRRVSEVELIDGMRRIADRNGIGITDEALGTIAVQANGSVRDALSILEQCIAAGDEHIDTDLVLEYTGSAGENFFLELTQSVIAGNAGNALSLIDSSVRNGKDAKQLLKEWLEHYRNLMIVKYVDKADRIVRASAENIDRIREQASGMSMADIESGIRLMSEYINLGRYSDKPRILLEVAAVKLAGGIAGDSTPVIGQAQKMGTRPLQIKKPEATAEPRRAEAPVKLDEPANEAPEQPALEQPIAEPAASKQPAMQVSNDPRQMWQTIVDSVSANDQMFGIVVGSNSRADSYTNQELLVTIKKNKLAFAEDYSSAIKDTARRLFGDHTVVTMRAGDVSGVQNVIKPQQDRPDQMDNEYIPEFQEHEMNPLEMIQQEQAEEALLDEDVTFGEMVEDIQNVLGVDNIDIVD